MLIEVTVKTLDSKNHLFSVEETLTVKEFKETISPTVSIPVENQRLIFRGRVLQDDKKILEYNVASNTVHLVQRPNAVAGGSNSNDEPPVRNGSEQDRFTLGDGSGTGIIITAGPNQNQNAIFATIGIPSVDIPVGEQTVNANPNGIPRRNSAAVRLQMGNEMINRASTILSRLEEDDELAAAQARQAESAAAAAAAATSTTSASAASSSNSSELSDSQSSDSMDIDPDDPAAFNRMISQAVLASVRNINPGGGGNDGMNIIGQLTGNNETNSAGGTVNNNNNNNNGAGSNRRQEAPRLREMAVALQDLISFQERLLPFLQFVQNILRQNPSFNADTGELQSNQYVFDSVQSILHLLGHGVHALSDLICDFSTPPETRRLTSTTGILVEQSTVVRATIPIAVPAFAGPLPNVTQQQQPQPQLGSWNPFGGNNQANVQSTTQTPPQNNVPNSPSTQRQTNTSIFSSNPSVQSGTPGISINIQSNAMPDLASLLGPLAAHGATGGNAGPFQQGMLPLIFGGTGTGIFGGNNSQRRQQQQQGARTQQTTPSPNPAGTVNNNNTSTTNGNTGNNNNNNNNNNGGGLNMQQSLRNELVRTPFDMLLPCHSHHTGRNRNDRQRPLDLHSHVKINTVQQSISNAAQYDFFQTFIDLIRSSNWIETLQPYLKDIVQNYLMRGRDIKNAHHIKTCARSIAKTQINFLKNFMATLSGRDETIQLDKTFSEFMNKFFFKVLSLIINSGPTRSFRNAILLLWDDTMTSLFTIFRLCFPNNNHVPEMLSKFAVDEYCGGIPLLLRTYLNTSLKEYFLAFSKSAESSTVNAQTSGLIVRIDDQGTSSSSSSTSKQQDTSFSTPSTSQISASIHVPSSSSSSASSLSSAAQSESSPPNKTVKKDVVDSMETDIDLDLLATPTPFSSEAARNEAPLRQIPSAWREVVERDIHRMQYEVSPPTVQRSPGFSALFPKKN